MKKERPKIIPASGWWVAEYYYTDPDASELDPADVYARVLPVAAFAITVEPTGPEDDPEVFGVPVVPSENVLTEHQTVFNERHIYTALVYAPGESYDTLPAALLTDEGREQLLETYRANRFPRFR
jgi:hypothetical protein